MVEAAGETTIYPDRTDFLPNPRTGDTDHEPHGVVKWVMRGNAQFRKFAAMARSEIKSHAAGAYAATDAADDQTRHRDACHETWAASQSRADLAHRALDGLVLHHGRGEPVRYVVTWILLIAGDVAAGTLLLVYAGEYPLYAAVMMTALGAAAVTTGLLGKDLRRRNLWLTRREHLPADDDAAELITDVFAVHDTGWRNTLHVVRAAVLGAACLVLGTLLFRTAVDNPLVGIAYGLWAVAIGAASFWNGWAHLDPAHTALRNTDTTVRNTHKAYTSAPTDAIAIRAGNLAAITETLAAYREDAWAAWYTCIAAAAEHLRVNPALAGHGTVGRSYLHELRPAEEDLFDLLADEYQIPRYRTTREPINASQTDDELIDLHGDDAEQTTGSVIDLPAHPDPADDTVANHDDEATAS